MAAGIEEPDALAYRCRLVAMHQVNRAGPLVQDNPDALVSAVLCDFGDRTPDDPVGCIVRRVHQLLVADGRRAVFAENLFAPGTTIRLSLGEDAVGSPTTAELAPASTGDYAPSLRSP